MHFDNTKICEMLFDAGASPLSTANALSVSEQHLVSTFFHRLSAPTVDLFIRRRGKDVLPSNAVLLAADSSQTGVMHILSQHDFDFGIRDSQGASVLHVAVQSNEVHLVEYTSRAWHSYQCDKFFGTITTLRRFVDLESENGQLALGE